MIPRIALLKLVSLSITASLLLLPTAFSMEGENPDEASFSPFAYERDLPPVTDPQDGEDPATFTGLFDFLGRTNSNTHFQNPGLMGLVGISLSSSDPESAPPQSLMDPADTAVLSEEYDGFPTLTLDLSDISLKPTHYRLTHPLSVDHSYLRNWVLEGSADQIEWISISQHTEDDSLNQPGASKLFPLGDFDGFTSLRLRVTGPNSSGKNNLVLSNIEFNGSVLGNNLSFAPAQIPKLIELAFDPEPQGESPLSGGVLDYFSAAQNEMPLNPSLSGRVKVLSSGLDPESPEGYELLSPVPIPISTPPVPDAWIGLKFPKGSAVDLCAYSLKLNPENNEVDLDDWLFQGSNDGLSWHTFHQGSLQAPDFIQSGIATWLITKDPSVPAFEYFRVLSTGIHSKSALPVTLYGIEIYGTTTDIPEIDCAPKQLDYVEDFDGNGIVAHFATSGGSQSYRNPSLLGLIQTSASSLMPDSEPAYAIVDDEAVRCVTRPEIDSWFEVNFGTSTIIPSHYSLRHYSTWDTEALRNWQLQASNDGETWVVLREHLDDNSLNFAGDTHTWAITSPLRLAGYNRFRIFQTGPNSNNHFFLALSGIEFNGIICPREPLPPEPAKTGEFTYQEDFDDNGIVHFLATRGGKEPYLNPGVRGLIDVSASSIMKDSEPAHSSVGQKTVRCVTKPIRDSWFQFDFHDIQIQPTHYSLRHYLSWDTEALRNWVLEASNDQKLWVPLITHLNDTSLQNKGDTATWAIPTPENNEFFRFFRVRQTGRNSNNHYYLALSGFEVYGEIKANSLSPEPSPSGGTDFTYNSDFDGNGLVAHLATNGRQEAYLNPVQRGLAKVTASSLMRDSSPTQAVLGEDTVRCVTKPITNSWFAVSFPTTFIRPNYYSLRHYSSWDTEALRNWKFQGSRDGIHWQTLREHLDDQSLTVKGDTASWPIQVSEENEFFNHFRILQTGRNSNQHHYLALSGFEIYGTVSTDLDLSQPVPHKQGLAFSSTTEFDGIIHYLATANGTRPFSNPVIDGTIGASSSSLMNDSEPVSSLAGPNAVRCVTKPQKNSWMKLDFKNLRVRPTHYSLRHYSSWDTEALRYWRLEGSNNNDTWFAISTHLNDSSLNSKGDTQTWAVDDSSKSYRYFRILQTDRNSNNHYYLALSGIEFYGDLESADHSDNEVYNSWAKDQGLPPGPAQNINGDFNADGIENFEHFIFASNPKSTSFSKPSIHREITHVVQQGGGINSHYNVTYPIRGATPLIGGRILGNGATYRLHASTKLQPPNNLNVREITPPLTGDLPALPPGYLYRTFQIEEPLGSQESGFLWLEVLP